MTIQDLATTLAEMYHNAPKGYKKTMVHLFGIKYSQTIKENKYTPAEIVKAANMDSSFGTEVYNGIRLSNYVELKK